MKKGIYYLPWSDQICFLFNVQNYEDLKNKFSIVSWEYEKGTYHKVLITSDQYRSFKYVGEL